MKGRRRRELGSNSCIDKKGLLCNCMSNQIAWNRRGINQRET